MKIYRLREAKTNQLRKLLNNGNITEEQFQIADEFFKKYSAFENEIDWNRGLKITWDDLKAVIYKERNSESKTKRKIRKGLEGFTEGKDYLVLDEGIYNGEPRVTYQPFTWEASRMIASHYVEPSKNEDGYLDDADWCTAYQKDRTYWDNHNEIEAFIYICGEDIPSKKVAISISEEDYDASGSEFLYSTGNLNFNIWDFNDYNNTIEEEELLEIVPNLYNLIEKAYKIWKEKEEEKRFSKLKLNPQTNRYDCDEDLDSKELRKFISANGKGFTINFGKITGNFDCSELDLISLKGAPQEVGGHFKCSNNRLTSLKGAPQIVGGAFNCSNNKLSSLKGAPQEVGKGFFCSGNKLISLEGAPRDIGGNFWCNNNQLTSLKGAPQKVGKDFNCSSNRLTSLEGAPQTVKGSFYCNRNHLTSLEGAPTEVGEDFECPYNQLISLKGAPKEVGGDFNCEENPNLNSLDGIGEVRGDIYNDL